MAFEDKSFPAEERKIITVNLYKDRVSFFVGSIEAMPIYTTSKEFIKPLSHQHSARIWTFVHLKDSLF